MGDLTNEFCAAASEWSQRTGDLRQVNVTHWVALHSGGWRVLAEARRGGQLRVEHIKEWLEVLTERLGMTEAFLVPGLIRVIESELEDSLANYAKGKESNTKTKEFLQEIAADPKKREQYFRWANDPKRQRLVPRLADEPEPEMDEQQLQGMIEMMERMSETTAGELLSRQAALDSWRELTATILDKDRVRESLRQQINATLQRYAKS